MAQIFANPRASLLSAERSFRTPVGRPTGSLDRTEDLAGIPHFGQHRRSRPQSLRHNTLLARDGMLFLNTATLELEEFYDTSTPRYAILSHTSGAPSKDGSFVEMKNERATAQSNMEVGFPRISEFCRISRERGHEYGWVDTFCISGPLSPTKEGVFAAVYVGCLRALNLAKW